MCDMTYTKACGPQVRVPGGSALLPVGAEAREGSGGKTPRECLEREREAGSRAVGAEDARDAREKEKEKEKERREDREEDGPKGRKAVVHHPGWRILQTADGSITSMLTQISRSGILPQVCRVCVQIV